MKQITITLVSSLMTFFVGLQFSDWSNLKTEVKELNQRMIVVETKLDQIENDLSSIDNKLNHLLDELVNLE